VYTRGVQAVDAVCQKTNYAVMRDVAWRHACRSQSSIHLTMLSFIYNYNATGCSLEIRQFRI